MHLCEALCGEVNARLLPDYVCVKVRLPVLRDSR